jgi:hypothetical protein
MTTVASTTTRHPAEPWVKSPAAVAGTSILMAVHTGPCGHTMAAPNLLRRSNRVARLAWQGATSPPSVRPNPFRRGHPRAPRRSDDQPRKIKVVPGIRWPAPKEAQ